MRKVCLSGLIRANVEIKELVGSFCRMCER
jgi:hypothetical protein